MIISLILFLSKYIFYASKLIVIGCLNDGGLIAIGLLAQNLYNERKKNKLVMKMKNRKRIMSISKYEYTNE